MTYKIRLRLKRVTTRNNTTVLANNTAIPHERHHRRSSVPLPTQHANIGSVILRVRMSAKQILLLEVVLAVDLRSQRLRLRIRKTRSAERAVNIQRYVLRTQIRIISRSCSRPTRICTFHVLGPQSF